jgi:TM2 domain-containing membrane protein YozV
MALSISELTYLEQRVANDAPTTGLAYVLWFFLWWASAHRFYTGRPGTAVLQILSYFVLVGFVWVIIDAFLIPGMVRDKKNEIRSRVMLQLSEPVPSHAPAGALSDRYQAA